MGEFERGDFDVKGIKNFLFCLLVISFMLGYLLLAVFVGYETTLYFEISEGWALPLIFLLIGALNFGLMFLPRQCSGCRFEGNGFAFPIVGFNEDGAITECPKCKIDL